MYNSARVQHKSNKYSAILQSSYQLKGGADVTSLYSQYMCTYLFQCHWRKCELLLCAFIVTVKVPLGTFTKIKQQKKPKQWYKELGFVLFIVVQLRFNCGFWFISLVNMSQQQTTRAPTVYKWSTTRYSAVHFNCLINHKYSVYANLVN